MTGMGTPTSTNNPVIVQAFHRALLHQGLIAVGILLVVLVAWNGLRAAQLRRARSAAGGQTTGPAATAAAGLIEPPEPAGRRVLRIGFGLLWILDGILQAQAAMPNGLIPQVVQPAAQGSPGWLVSLVNDGARVWTYHPVTAAAAAVWVQIGIGLWLLAAPRGNWSRLGGVASAGWGLCVWIFGEALGALLAPGLSWLDGAPGAALIYALAGVAVAVPESYWRTPRLGRVICRAAGGGIVALGVLQAWPGRGFWEGQPSPHAAAGSLVSMVDQMAQTPQPGAVESAVTGFASFTADHGWAVNLVVVVAMLAIGAGFVAARPRVTRAALAAGAVLCLATWVLVQDMGFFGGLGTDPNSMIPWLLLLLAGYLGLTRPARQAAEAVAPEPGWRLKLTQPGYALRVTAALAAVAVTLLGAAPMAAATADPNADAIIATETDGPVTATNLAAPDFHLVDQDGRPVSLGQLRGKTLAVTFLDPVCTNDCPAIASEFRQAAGLLAKQNKDVELIAICANPQFRATAFLQAFDRQEGLDRVSNWEYLTGSSAVLDSTWRQFGVEVSVEPGGAMIDHSDIAFVIDPAGRIRYVLDADPGPADPASESSFAVTLKEYVDKAQAER